MKTSNRTFIGNEPSANWLNNNLVPAIDALKLRLQARYERFLPGETAAISKALENAESIAWSTSFPQLFLPDLVEEEISRIIPSSSKGESQAHVLAHAA